VVELIKKKKKQRKLAPPQQDNNYCVIMFANNHKYQHFNDSLSFPTLTVRLNGGTWSHL